MSYISRKALLVVTLASSAMLAGCHDGRVRLASTEIEPAQSVPGEERLAAPSTLAFMPTRHGHAVVASGLPVQRHPLRRGL